MLQTNWKFIKYLMHNKHSITPKQLKKKPIKQIIKIIPHQTLDIDEGESTNDEEETTTSKNCQKIQHLIHLLKLQKSQNQLKHLKFIMFSTNQHMMKMIHIKTNL